MQNNAIYCFMMVMQGFCILHVVDNLIHLNT